MGYMGSLPGLYFTSPVDRIVHALHMKLLIINQSYVCNRLPFQFLGQKLTSQGFTSGF